MLLTGITGDAIRHIIINRAGAEAVAFQRFRHWQLTGPLKAYANPGRIASMLTLLQSRSYARFDYGDIADLEPLGLSAPKIRLQLDDQSFYFGGTDPLNNHRYVRVDDEIHLIKDRLYPQLLQPAMFFISKQVLPPDSTISHIRLPGLTIHRQAAGWLATPANGLTQQQLGTIIEHWQVAEADTLTPITRQTGADTVTVTADGRRIQFHYVVADGRIFLIREDENRQYELSDRVARILGLR